VSGHGTDLNSIGWAVDASIGLVVQVSIGLLEDQHRLTEQVSISLTSETGIE
jgi:hypothetical protein